MKKWGKSQLDHAKMIMKHAFFGGGGQRICFCSLRTPDYRSKFGKNVFCDVSKINLFVDLFYQTVTPYRHIRFFLKLNVNHTTSDEWHRPNRRKASSRSTCLGGEHSEVCHFPPKYSRCQAESPQMQLYLLGDISLTTA